MGKQAKNDTEFILKSLGKRIATIRIEKGLKQSELAFRCNFDDPNMSRIENGRTNVTVGTLNKICKELDISVSDLFSGL